MTGGLPTEILDLVVDDSPARLNIATLGLACCGIEVRAAVRLAAHRQGGAGPGPVRDPDLNILLVAGTINLATTELVEAALAALPEPRLSLAFGACAISGGPYWDSYAVVPGASGLGPVDVYLPGCPPRPAELLDALEAVIRERRR